MSSNRSTSKNQSEKGRKAESDSKGHSSLHDPPSSAGSRHSNSSRVKHVQALPSDDGDTQADIPNQPRPKSSRTNRTNSAGLNLSSPAQNRRIKSSYEGQKQRTSIDKKTSEAEQWRQPSHASMHSDARHEDTDPSPRPPRKNKNETPSSTARPKSSRPSVQRQGQRCGYRSSNMDSNPRPLDLRKGNNYYLYCLAKIYDITDMKRQKEMQYWNLLARQRQLGFHSPKECEPYMRYLSRPRTAEYSTSYSGQHRAKSTDARRREETGRKSRTEDKGKSDAGCDRKPKAASSKATPVSSKATPVSSKESRHKAKNQRDEEDDDEEVTSGRIETTDEESETSQNEDEKENVQKPKKKNSGEDQKNAEGRGSSSVSLTCVAAEAGDESDGDETSDADDADRRSNIIPRSDGNIRAEDASGSVRHATEEASSDDRDSDTDDDRSDNDVKGHEDTALRNAD